MTTVVNPGILLRAPLDVQGSGGQQQGQRTEVKFHRSAAGEVRNLSEKFRLVKRDFQRQYFHVYHHRLEKMRAAVEQEARANLPQEVLVRPLCRLDTVPEGEDVLIIGTLFKNQKNKPNILQELSEENGLPPPPQASSRGKYIGEDDDIILEDDLQRIKLRGDVPVTKLVTGIVCGMYGMEKESGKFEVKNTFFASTLPQPEWPLTTEKDRFLVFLSGLELADESSSSLFALQLAIDWIVGEAGEMGDQEKNSLMERVIIAGNSLNESTRDKDGMNKAKYLTKDIQAGSIDAVKLLDGFLVQLAGSVDTDLMPGEFDPASHILPQQPLHPCLFPLASVYPTLKTVSNPYMLEIDGYHITGTSGQNTDDVLRNTDMESPLDAMQALLSWSHLAPTCPDTLSCFPYRDEDPFIIASRPHIMFTANQTNLNNRLVDGADGKKTKLLSIPIFAKTSSIVLLNLRTLEAEEVCFSTDLQKRSS